MKNFNKRMVVSLFMALIMMVHVPTVSFAAELTVSLGTADSFVVLAGSTITNTGTTILGGDVGLHPGTVFTGQGTATISGSVHLTDAVASVAKDDLEAAYNNAAGRTTNLIDAELGAEVLNPGVYSNATSFQVTGTLTLDAQNDPNAVFIFQAGSTLTTASNSKIILINGANANNIFWQVGSSATLGTNSEFVGNILSSESITAQTGAKIQGKLLALDGAVTLDNNTILATESSTLRVIKMVTGPIGNMTLPAFEITVTGEDGFTATRDFVHGESYTWIDLVPGDYNVVESRVGLDGQWTVSGEGPLSIIANQAHLVTITNDYTLPVIVTPVETTPVETATTPVGALRIEKTVIGDSGDRVFSPFRITVTGPEGFTAVRAFIHGETHTWEDLVPGNYTVTENREGLDNEWTVSGEGTVAVLANETQLVSITNVYTPIVAFIPIALPLADALTTTGTLTVEKTVTGAIGSMMLPTFEMTITGPEGFTETRTFVHGGSYTWENLVPGEYRVTENRMGLNSNWTVFGEGLVAVVANEIAIATITNHFESGEPIPQTGQETNYGMAIVFGSLAVIIAGVGVYLGFKKKRLNE